MKKLFLLVVFIFLATSTCFSQAAEIVDLNGKVLVKMDISSSWKKAKIGMTLSKQAEIETRVLAKCTIAFDEELSNVITVAENTHIKLDSLVPGKISMPRGRVFSVIDDITKVKEFEIRMPTAVAGVRGTGFIVGVSSGGLQDVLCLEGTVSVGALGSGTAANPGGGSPIGLEMVPAGSGINVDFEGNFSELFEIPDYINEEWNQFAGDIEGVRTGTEGSDSEGEFQGGFDGGVDDASDFLDDIKDEGQSGFADDVFEEFKKEKEKKPEEEGGGNEITQ